MLKVTSFRDFPTSQTGCTILTLERPSKRKRTASKITEAVLLRCPIKTSYPLVTHAYELCQYQSGQAPDTSSPYPEWNVRAVSAVYMGRRHFSNTESRTCDDYGELPIIVTPLLSTIFEMAEVSLHCALCLDIQILK